MDLPSATRPRVGASSSFAPALPPLRPEPPGWVHRLLGRSDRIQQQPLHPLVDTVLSGSLARLTTRVPEAIVLSATQLSDVVAARYALLHQVLRELGRHAIRLWNYVPGIVDEMEPGLNRYMAFNRGRYAAFAEAWGIDPEDGRRLPTASAVGVGGSDLVIDCLASVTGGKSIENPRQTASWRYSRRHGPRPPCFARGTIARFDPDSLLLVGGTASIVGEESRHEGDVLAQAAEALANIETVVAAAGGPAHGGLASVTDFRVYLVRATDAPIVEGLLRAHASAARIEVALARVCRPELLVEIEAVAPLPADRRVGDAAPGV